VGVQVVVLSDAHFGTNFAKSSHKVCIRISFHEKKSVERDETRQGSSQPNHWVFAVVAVWCALKPQKGSKSRQDTEIIKNDTQCKLMLLLSFAFCDAQFGKITELFKIQRNF
jgi:hypothetical protein